MFTIMVLIGYYLLERMIDVVKQDIITIRVKAEDKKEFVKCAASKNRSLSNWLLTLAYDAINRDNGGCKDDK